MFLGFPYLDFPWRLGALAVQTSLLGALGVLAVQESGNPIII
jgi:hypothetical protein